MLQTLTASARQRFTLTTMRAALMPHRLAVVGITLISAFGNFWMLGQNGFGNLYYAATVKSMGSNWHAFFFASFDPAGFVTVDKPPVGFWLQVVSTKIFGFTPFAVFLPQALAGVVSVTLLYWLVRRHFGRIAGLIAAVALAVSPISVVTNRNNTIDSTLMLVLLLAAWATFRAIETDHLRWLIVSGVLVGLGFNIKMLEAYLVVPAFALAYLLSSRKSWLQRSINLVGTGAVMLGISLAWVLAVDFIPAGLRPWVGSTQNNSELSLAFGYNGVQRLLGMGGVSGGAGGRPAGGNGGPPQGGFPGGRQGFPPRSGTGTGNGTFPGFPGTGGLGTGNRPGAGGPPQGGPGGGAGLFNTGNPGVLRLFTEPLGGQIVWLLPLALLGIIALAAQRRFRPREDRQQQSLILWGTWLLTMGVFFSVASFFHQYYLSQMAPAIAALAGIGIVTMWDQYLQPGWRGWLLPITLAVTAAEQIFIITSNPTWGTWLIPIIAVPATLAALALAVLRLKPDALTVAQELVTTHTPRNLQRTFSVGAVTLGLAAILVTPTVWSLSPALTNTVSDLPTAGATTMIGNAAPANQTNAQLISYLEAHQGSATYLVATPSSNAADAIILASGKPVMALGGFTGTDPILTDTAIQTLVNQGTVRYFLLNGAGNASFAGSTTPATTTGSVINVGGPNGNHNTAVQWVQQNCTVVPTSAWQTSSGTTPDGGSQALYVCTST